MSQNDKKKQMYLRGGAIAQYAQGPVFNPYYCKGLALLCLAPPLPAPLSCFAGVCEGGVSVV